MAIQQSFNILTAFKFEVGAALASSNQMGKALDGLSEKAKGLNEQLKFSAIQWGAQLTGAQFGILGFFRNLLETSEETYDIQRRMATLITNNPKAFAEGPLKFKDAMQVSEGIMKNIVKEADKFGLDTTKYFYKIEGINAALFGKGVTGVNFQNSRKLARNIMLGSEMLPGLENIDIQNSMLALVMGQARRGQKLWDTLRADTKTLGGITAPQFNRMTPAGRVENLNKAYEELIKNEDALLARMNKLSVQMTRLRDRFTGILNITTKMGEVLRQFVIENIKLTIKFVDDQLAPVFDKLGGVLKKLVEGKSLVDLYFQIKELGTISKSVSISGTLASLSFGLTELAAFLASFPKVRGALFKGLRFLGVGLAAGASKITVVFAIMSKVFGFLLRAVTYYAKFWAAAFTVSRIWEKAKIQADKLDTIAFGKKIGDLTTQTIGLSEALIKLTAPFKWFTEKTAELVSPFMSVGFWLEQLGKVLGFLGNVEILSATSAMDQFTLAINSLGNSLIKYSAGIMALGLKFSKYVLGTLGMAAGSGIGGPIGAAIGGLAGWGLGSYLGNKTKEKYGDLNLGELMDEIEKEMRAAKETGEKSFVQNNLTNIAKVEIRNQFSENFDADRVAVTLMDQLEQASQNPLGSINSNPSKIAGLQTARN